MRRNEQGFSALESLLLLVIVGLVGFIGWYVYHSNQKTDSQLTAASQSTNTRAARPASDLLTFFEPKDPTTSFKYPNSWSLSTYAEGVDMGDGNRNVVVTSAAGSKVVMTSTGAGIGGDCQPTERSKVTYSKKIPGASNLYVVDWELFDSTNSVVSGIDVLNASGDHAFFAELGDHPGCIPLAFAFSSTKYTTSGYWFGTEHSGQQPKAQDVKGIHAILESLKVQ